MDLVEVSSDEYKKLISRYISIFDTPDFNNLNSYKCDAVKFLLFYKKKLKFGLIGGISSDKFIFPFSAPYASLTPMRLDIQLSDYYDSIGSLLRYLINNVSEVKVTLPPFFYNQNHHSFLSNSLLGHDFAIQSIDINYHVDLTNFDRNNEFNINIKAKQKLKSALKHNLKFKLCTSDEDKQLAYRIIQENRCSKNYPLHLKMEQIIELSPFIKIDFFLIVTPDNLAIASAICYHVAENIIQIIYWGNRPGNEEYRPMNFLSYHIFEYYKKKGIKYVDIGPSSQNGLPNFGLSNFKQSIGCDFSVKLNLIKTLS